MRSLRLAILILLAFAAQASAAARPSARTERTGRARAAASRMAMIPAGSYRPLYAPVGTSRIRVAAFALDREPVTRADFLAFVSRQPSWQRGRVRSVFADAGYLADWRGVLDAGDADGLRRPVTQVSWFAARAYCASVGKRLPTVDEWEYAAAANERSSDASGDPAFRARLLALYGGMRRSASDARGFVNVHGVRALHGQVWEWTLDFNSVVLDDDSRTTGSGADARDRHLYCASSAIGATDPSDYPAFLRYAVRAGLGARSTTSTVGFRCAADVPVS